MERSAATGAAPSRAWQTSFEAVAYQSFLAGLKRHWGGELYREVVGRAQACGAHDADGLEAAMRGDAAYRLYAWLERRIQQLKWSGRWGFATLVEQQRAHLEPLLAQAGDSPYLRLDPDLPLPEYVTGTETHQQPGGLWRDPLNAYALAWYTTGLSFAGSDPDDLVDFYAARLRERCDELGLAPRAILDEGCTAGRSTRAIRRAFPEAQVTGCDVCEGSLRLGALRTAEDGPEVTLVQSSVEALAFPEGSFDVVASQWLWHELPPAAIRRSIAEAARVLRPGGLFAAYDMMSAPGGAVGRWLLSGYAARNNEPYAHALLDFDWRAELARAGFTDVRARYGLPQDPGPDAPAGLPPRRLHPMVFVSARRAGPSP
jgi:SAM-dependent methyltransferase